MTFDTVRISEDLPNEELDLPSPKGAFLSRSASLDSNGTGVLLLDNYSSDELDKLSSCLSEVSSDSSQGSSTSMFYDIVQAQLALWTCVFSLLYSYAWGQHRKKFIMSIFIVIPTVFAVCCAISTLLTTIVIIGRLFSTPIAYREFLNLDRGLADMQDSADSGSRRQRCYSGASDISMTSEDYLPKPLCRRHSSSHGSLCSRPPSVNRKLSYAYSHYSANDDDDST